MPELPSHASPYLSPQSLEAGQTNSDITDAPSLSLPYTRLRETQDDESQESGAESDKGTPAVPASFLSPAFTPPATPGGTINLARLAQQPSLSEFQQDKTHVKSPTLLSQLPKVECIVRARIPTTTGAEMFLHLYHNDLDDKEHLAIVFGNTIRSRSLDCVRPGETEMDRMIRGAYVGKLHPGRTNSWYDDDKTEGNSSDTRQSGEASNGQVWLPRQAIRKAPLVRIHSECYTGETAWSARCDCGEQLDEAARLMSFPNETWGNGVSSADAQAESPGGVIIYLRQEGRGIGLGEKLKAYNLQDLGSDTVEANLLLRHPADARSYGLATAMLVDLGLGVDSNPEGIRLLTNNFDKVRAVEGPNREVVVKERVPMIPLAWRTGGEKGIKSSEVEAYLRTKIAKMGHIIQ